MGRGGEGKGGLAPIGGKGREGWPQLGSLGPPVISSASYVK